MGTGQQGNYSGQAIGAAVTVMVNYLVAYLATVIHAVALGHGWVAPGLAIPPFTTEMVQSEQLLMGLVLTWWMTKEGVELPGAPAASGAKAQGAAS